MKEINVNNLSPLFQLIFPKTKWIILMFWRDNIGHRKHLVNNIPLVEENILAAHFSLPRPPAELQTE